MGIWDSRHAAATNRKQARSRRGSRQLRPNPIEFRSRSRGRGRGWFVPRGVGFFAKGFIADLPRCVRLRGRREEPRGGQCRVRVWRCFFFSGSFRGSLAVAVPPASNHLCFVLFAVGTALFRSQNFIPQNVTLNIWIYAWSTKQNLFARMSCKSQDESNEPT